MGRGYNIIMNGLDHVHLRVMNKALITSKYQLIKYVNELLYHKT